MITDCNKFKSSLKIAAQLYLNCAQAICLIYPFLGCLSPGTVQVNVMTQNGDLLGTTDFEYFDDRIEIFKEIVQSLYKHPDHFFKWLEVCKSVPGK